MFQGGSHQIQSTSTSAEERQVERERRTIFIIDNMKCIFKYLIESIYKSKVFEKPFDETEIEDYVLKIRVCSNIFLDSLN